MHPTYVPPLAPGVPVRPASEQGVARTRLTAAIGELVETGRITLSDDEVWATCPRCEGDCVTQGPLGLRECGECGGRGEVRTFVDYEERLVECFDCGGAGEHCYEPPGWWHGSGVMVESTQCSRCAGSGEIDLLSADERERAFEAAVDYAERLRFAQQREEAADKWRAVFPEIRYTDDVPF